MGRHRAEALRDKPYDPAEVEALLSLGDLADLPPRTTSGLVEMQRIFLEGRGPLRPDTTERVPPDATTHGNLL